MRIRKLTNIIGMIVGILILVGNASIISASNVVGSSTGGSALPVYDPPIVTEGQNLALYNNGGRINFDQCWFMNKNDLKDNLCIDGSVYTKVRDDSDKIYWGDTPYAQIEIDLAGGYHQLYSIDVVYDISEYNNCEKILIQAYTKEKGWIDVVEDRNLGVLRSVTAPTILLENNKGELYEISKIRVRFYTDLYAQYLGYYHSDSFSINEIRAYEATYDYEPPSITNVRPDSLNVASLYVSNIKIIPLPFQHYSIMVESTINLIFGDDLSIKEYTISQNGNLIDSKTFSIEDSKSQIVKDIFVPNGKSTFKITVKDFANRKTQENITVLGFRNSPACLTSKPMGPDSGKIRNIYTYSVKAIDVENDPIEYGWDWNGDGSVDQWTSSNTASHSWSKPGEYKIIVSVKEANSGRLGLWTMSKIVNIKRDSSSLNIESSQSSAILTSITSTTTTKSSGASSVSVSTSGTTLKTNTILR